MKASFPSWASKVQHVKEILRSVLSRVVSARQWSSSKTKLCKSSSLSHGLPPKKPDRTGAEHRPNPLLLEDGENPLVKEDSSSFSQLLVITMCQKILDCPYVNVDEFAYGERSIHSVLPFAVVNSALRLPGQSSSWSHCKIGLTFLIERNASFEIHKILGSTLAVKNYRKSDQPQLWFRNDSTDTASSSSVNSKGTGSSVSSHA
jgi:hypothetical protein